MANNWNDDWREELASDYPDAYERLCDCRNKRSDILLYAKLIYKHNPSKSKQDCLDRSITWITDWNNQYNLYPDAPGEYEELLSKL